MMLKKMGKSSINFCCEHCDYNTSRKSQYDRHLLTDKHKMVVNMLNLNIVEPKSSQLYKCICGKTYKYDSGYYRHKKNCEMINAEVDVSDLSSDKETEQSDKDKEKDQEKEQLEKELLVTFMKEMKDTMLEMFKHLQPNNTTMSHSHNNSHNNTFNLQFFLNEQCKDALNITEFVSSINIKLSDLENTGRLGYVEGISRILINNLKDLDTHKRPIHCSDLKREVLYIKSDDKWEKDDEDNQQIRSAIKQVANKNIRQIPAWTNVHPEFKDPTSKQNDQYLKIVSNSMSGITSEEQVKNVSQIIKNLAKEVVISKMK
jgi:hypothetical protein